MSSIRLLFLWHMHQPYYKDLVTGEYRLPWVRLHALKDYYGMVKLLDEFPGVHQTFNLVPSLIAQINDYVAGAARDPFLEIVSRRADEFDYTERLFAVQYLFQSNLENMISRYPRYRQLWEEFRQFRRRTEDAAQAAREMNSSDITDLQVLSQIAWMDEFFLDDPDIRGLIAKQRDYSFDDQQLVLNKEREFLGKVLPAYAGAAQHGTIEISTSPYYHPILPLVCDTDIGAVSHPGVPLPRRFRHPEDARAQIDRGLDLHEKVFGVRPQGMWPSEGSVSDEALTIAHNAGLHWVATDEGVLGRSLNTIFHRDDRGNLDPSSAGMLYQIFHWEQGPAQMHVIFRDHSLSDLIGFVYSGIPAQDAAADFIRRIKNSAAPLLAKGIDAVVPVILDGENAWETYPQSGREFLRRLYQGIEKDDSFEALTVSEAIARQSAPKQLTSIFPGSWISANFDVWIGAPEDNQSWDHLSAARDFFSKHSAQVSDESRELAYEELLIAEGSDWNWWYGPEHHSANDQDFDELYRKHLSNVYHALGATPPEALAQPISGGVAKVTYTPQTAYIHPQIDGKDIGYFDWLGAATYVADRRSAAMHGKLFLLDTGYAGVDEENLYCRLDFMESPDEWSRESARLLVTIEPVRDGIAAHAYCLETEILSGQIQNWNFSRDRQPIPEQNDLGIGVSLESIFECQLPLALLRASTGTLLRVRFSLWRGQLPLDSLPQEGSIELRVLPEDELIAVPYAKP